MLTRSAEVESAAPRQRAFLQRIAVQDGSRLIVLRAEEIDWIEADLKFLKLHVGKKPHRLRQTMAQLQSVLDPHKFIQVHRSHVVNVESIAELDFSEPNKPFVMLKSGRRVPLARSYRKQVRNSLTRIH